MKKLLLFLIIVFLAFAGDAQNYFEKAILHDDNITRDAALVIETQEHGFIVSCRTKFIYQNDMLLSLSPEGEVTNSLTFQIDGKNIKYCELFKDAERDDEYIAMAVLSSGNSTQSCVRNEIAVLHLDANLEIKSHQTCGLGENVINILSKNREMPRFVQEDDGNFFMAAHCQMTDGYCYLFLRITPNGDIVKMEEDYSHGSESDQLKALFERSKADKNYGMIRLQNDGEYYYKIDSAFNATRIARLLGTTIKIVQNDPQQQYPDTTFKYAFRGGYMTTYDDETFLLTSPGYYMKHYGGILGWNHYVAKINDSMQALVAETWDCVEETNPLNRVVANVHALSVANNAIYHCGMNGLKDQTQGYVGPEPSEIVVSKFDMDLNLIWRRWYGVNDDFYNINTILATEDGGCILAGYHAKAPGYYAYYSYILKVDENGYDAVGENAESVAKPYFCYPNPAKDNIDIELSPDVNCQSVEIYTLDGRLVETLPETSQQTTINVENLNAGVYILKIKMADGREFSEKIIKE